MKQRINPILLMNRPAHRNFQRVGGNVYMVAGSRGDSGQQPADFHAFGASSGVLKALVKGVGDVTFDRNTAATVTDAFGQVKTVLPDELRFEYGRRVENLFKVSTEDLTSGWSTGGGATIDGPQEVSFPAASTANMTQSRATAGLTFAISADIKCASGTEQARLRLGSTTNVSPDFTVDTTWRRYAWVGVANGSGAGLQNASDGQARTLQVTKLQVELVEDQENQNPGEYVSVGVVTDSQFHGVMVDGVSNFDHTNPNEVDGNNVVNATVPMVTFGVDILGSDRSLSGWGVSLVTLGDTVTAYDGTTLTNNGLVMDNNEGIFEIFNSVTLTAGVPYRYVFLAKAGAYAWCRAQINTQTVPNYQFFHLSGAGAIGTGVGSVKSKITQLSNGWYRCEMTVSETVTGSRNIRIAVAEADGDDLISTGGGSSGIYVDFTEVLPGYDDWRRLFEQASENVVTQSADFTSGGGDWTVGNDVESIEDSNPSPIQSKNWWRLQAVAGGADVGRRILSNTHTKAAAVETWTATLYVEPDEVTWLRFQIQNPAVSKYVRLFFDLNGAGAVGTPTGATWTHIASDIKKISSGAYRIRVTLQTDTDTSILMNATLSSADGNTNTTLTTGQGLRIQGAQLEKSSVPTTLIITTGAALGRTADDGDGMFDDANFEQANGAWYTDVWYGALNTGGANGIMSLHDGPSSVIYEQNAEHRANDGGGSSVVILEPSAVDYRLKVVTNFETAGPLDVGMRDVEGHGAFKWDATPKTYDGSFPTGANAININYAISVPSRLRDLKGFKTSKGQQWFEENE